MIIGIAGGSASGKSTLAGMICDRVEDAIHCSLDDFYLDEADQPETWDDPSALDWNEVIDQVLRFEAKGTIEIPEYDFEQVKRIDSWVHHGNVLVIEGLWTLYDAWLRRMLDVAVFIDTPADVRLMRRVRRDTEERGTTVEETLRYFEQAREKEKEYVAPYREHADFVIEGRPTEQQAEILARMV